MSYRLSIMFLCCFSLLSLSVSSQERQIETRPRFDPFKKPDQLKSKNLFQTKLQLFATLRAGKNSMVNVQGRIVQLGNGVRNNS